MKRADAPEVNARESRKRREGGEKAKKSRPREASNLRTAA
jgi:hypothetical protein